MPHCITVWFYPFWTLFMVKPRYQASAETKDPALPLRYLKSFRISQVGDSRVLSRADVRGAYIIADVP